MVMNDGILSQEELDALLSGLNTSGDIIKPTLSDSDKDLLGEVGNIAMGSASTALSTIIQNMVNITTPKVITTTLNEMKKTFEVPIVALQVEYTKGLEGVNLLLMKITDAVIIADLMMGGDGTSVKDKTELSDIELSAVSEAMNQMVGSAATALAKLLNKDTNITPPIGKVWNDKTQVLSDKVDADQELVKISFKLTIGDLVDSEIMLLLVFDTAKAIINSMTNGNSTAPVEEHKEDKIEKKKEPQIDYNSVPNNNDKRDRAKDNKNNNVKKAEFSELKHVTTNEVQNIDLILDVPLEISAVLGRTKKTIKEILELGTGSLVELDNLTEDPVEILVNGKRVAYGEVVVIDENFGVRITSIVSNTDRIKSLQD